MVCDLLPVILNFFFADEAHIFEVNGAGRGRRRVLAGDRRGKGGGPPLEPGPEEGI